MSRHFVLPWYRMRIEDRLNAGQMQEEKYEEANQRDEKAANGSAFMFGLWCGLLAIGTVLALPGVFIAVSAAFRSDDWDTIDRIQGSGALWVRFSKMWVIAILIELITKVVRVDTERLFFVLLILTILNFGVIPQFRRFFQNDESQYTPMDYAE